MGNPSSNGASAPPDCAKGTSPVPEDFVDRAPPDRFCDLVLTGGVTSGVIYPAVAVELAREYRFKSIAGTSAGAMAAALVAAAEYRRYTGVGTANKAAGFKALANVPEELGKDPEEPGKDAKGQKRLLSRFRPAPKKQTRLLSLFQPTPKTRRLFRLFFDMLNASEDGSGSRWSRALVPALIKHYWWALVVPLLLGFTLAYVISPLLLGVIVGVCAFATAGAVCVALRIYDDLKNGMVPNGFGLCKGSGGSSEKPALIDWLHASIQKIAGKELDKPLTFYDLWHAGELPDWLERVARKPEDKKAIDLQIITANLTHGRPYRLPLDKREHSSRLFFKVSEWETYFPKEVMTYLLSNSICPGYAQADKSEPSASGTCDFRQLPEEEYLPVVVAARLSLSFPFLFSAVPLWAIDFEPPEKDGADKRKLQRCWFSDGGICSNFPIHLFDNFLPKWPTFGISLGRRSVFQSKPIWLPGFHNEGAADSWNRFGDDTLAPDFKIPRSPLRRLVGFTMSIIATAKDWNDNTVMRMPGVRDRVVRVGFCKNEGELNIGLTSKEISTLAKDYGTDAGKELVERFISRSPNGATSEAWNDHRWVRFNALLQSLRDRVWTISLAAETTPYTQPFKAQIARAFSARALQGTRDAEAPLSAAQADALDGLLAALIQLEKQFEKYTAEGPYRADPMPSLRSRPPL